jgi:hypothetical protein
MCIGLSWGITPVIRITFLASICPFAIQIGTNSKRNLELRVEHYIIQNQLHWSCLDLPICDSNWHQLHWSTSVALNDSIWTHAWNNNVEHIELLAHMMHLTFHNTLPGWQA